MPELGTAYIRVRGDLTDLNKALAANLAPVRLSKLGKAAGASLAGGLAAAAGGKALFELGQKFDDAFDRVRVATGATGEELKGFEDDLKAVFKSTPVDIDSVATAIGGLGARLDIQGEPLQKLAKQLLQLSKITKTDIGENVESVTRLFKDWMVPTGQQAETLDGLFRVGQRTGATISNLSRLMVQFGSPLRQLGFDFETAATMFGRFEKEGVNIQTIMPGFRFALKNLSAPSGEAAAMLEKLGISAKDPKIALQEVFKAIKDAPTAMKANAIAFAIFGKRAGPDMAAAVREGRFELDALKKTMRDGTDTIDKAEKGTRDFGEQWQLLKNRVFVGLEPIARKVFTTVGKGMEELATADLSQIGKDLNVKPIVAAFAEIGKVAAVALGPPLKLALAVAVESLKAFAQAVTGTVQLVSAALTLDLGKAWEAVKRIFASSPLGPIIGSLVLYKTAVLAAGAATRVYAATVAAVRAIALAPILAQWVAGLTAQRVAAVGSAVASQAAAAAYLAQAAAARVATAATVTLAVASRALPWVAIATAVGVAAVLIIKHWDKVKSALLATWNAIKAAASAVFGVVGRLARTGLLGPVPLIISRWGEVKNSLSRAWGAIKDAAQSALGGVGRIARLGLLGPAGLIISRWREVSGVLGKVFRSIRSVAEGSFGGIRDAIGWVIDKIRDLVGWIKRIKFPGVGEGVPFVPGVAKGGVVSGLALVGEEGPELARLPGGKHALVGQEGPEILAFPERTRVFSHPETKRKLAPIAQKVVQKLVPVAIPEPKSLTQRVVQESLGTDSRRESPRPFVSKASEGLRTPRFVAQARKLGIPGFARGGVVAAEPIAQASRSSRIRDQMERIWKYTAPYFKAKGQPMPKIRFPKHRPKSKWLRDAYAWFTPERNTVTFTPQARRDFRRGDDYAETTLLHEWAHVFQGAGLKKRWEIEGGAEAFAQRIADTVFDEADVPHGPSPIAYWPFVRRVNREKSDKWIMDGQFSVEPAQKRIPRQEKLGGDSGKPGTRTARASRDPTSIATVTPAEVTAITKKWGVNRAVASIGAAVKDKFPLMNIISGYFGRENSRTPSNSVSNHARRAALDLGSRGSLNTRIGSWVRANFPESLRGTSEGVLDLTHDPTPPDHADHVHVAAFGSKAFAKVLADGDDDGRSERVKPKRITGGRLSLGQLVTLAKQAGFPDPALAAAIAYAESNHGQVRAHNTDGEDSRGLWQINVAPNANPKYKDWNLFDARVNAKAAFQISKGGKNWKPWSVYTSGAYRDYLGGKAAPLPKGTSKAPTGSSYADELAMRMTDSLDTLSNADDLKWINRALRYWRGVYRRNKRAGNFARANEAKQQVQDLKAKRKELRDAKEEIAEDAFTLGDLIHIGKPPKALDISWMNRFVFEPLELRRAKAALTTPPDDDPSQAAIAASLQDDIAAASDLKMWWERLYTMTTGFRLPAQYPNQPFKPTAAQQKWINAVPDQAGRLARYSQLEEEHRLGPWVVGTIKQQIEAATNLGSAKDELKNLTDEAGRTEAAEEPVSAASTKTEDIKSFLAQIRELFKQFGSNIQPLQSFQGGGVIQGPKGKPVTVEAHGGEVVFDPQSGRLTVVVDKGEAEKVQQIVNNIDARAFFQKPREEPHIFSVATKKYLEALI